MTKARDLADLLDASGNIIAQGTIDGRDIASDGSKLDSIEHGATGDQTHSEIRALITAGVDTNVFTDADHSKLDGIEAGATADQTAAEIKTAYESNANTNEFSDAEQSKLAGIETGATADQTKADIDALNVDADTLDGQHGSYYTSYADTAVANIVDSAPGTLDTLNELAAALGDDPNFATTTATNIGTKANKTITVSAGSGLTGGGDLTANRTISHADTSSQASLTALTGAAVVSDIDVDTYGHVTGLATRNITLANLGYTGETNANYITNNNQLTNGAGYTTNVGDITGVTAGSGITGGGTSGTVTINHADTSSQASVDNSNGTVIQDITLDTYGHITGIASANLDGRYYTESEADSRFVNQTGDTMTGPLTIDTNTSGMLRLSATNSSPWAIDLQRDDTTNSRVYNGGGFWNFEHTPRAGGNVIWHAGNDGSGSGLDADLLDGLQLHTGRNNEANRVVRTQGSGYAEFGWINTTSGDTSSSLSRIYVDTGDGYIRKSTLAHVASQLPISAGAPAGSIIYHAGSSAPSGYVKANGASLSTSTYADLFAAIGYTYGGSGGSFNVPDLRGEFLRGWDDSRGVDSGRSFGSYQADELRSHSHSIYLYFYDAASPQNQARGSYPATYKGTVSTAASGGTETRPRNRALLACIKY